MILADTEMEARRAPPRDTGAAAPFFAASATFVLSATGSRWNGQLTPRNN